MAAFASAQHGYFSKPLRDQLKSLAIVVDVMNSVNIDEYYKLAKILYEEGLKTFKQCDLETAYIHFFKVSTLLIESLPKHNAYNSVHNRRNKSWGIDVARLLIGHLDSIIVELDSRELKKQQLSKELELIDEFDSIPEVSTCESSFKVLHSPHSLELKHHSTRSGDIIRNKSKEEIPSITPNEVQSAFDRLRIGYLETQTQSSTSSGRNTFSFRHSNFLPTPMSSSATFEDEKSDFAILSIDHQIMSSVQMKGFQIPEPRIKIIELRIGSSLFMFSQDDFHVSFSLFLTTLTPSLQVSPPAIETNRCFFIHLGIAIGIHPFGLQTVFRKAASLYLAANQADSLAGEILSSVLEYAGLVDANLFIYLWPSEFYDVKICIISGSLSNPIISMFHRKDLPVSQAREVIIRYEHNHFTLLRPVATAVNAAANTFSFLDSFLADARAAGVAVQAHLIETTMQWSILSLANKLI